MMKLKAIKEILEDRIVVPEIQREYVWGSNKKNPEIVHNFVVDINDMARIDRSFQLGFLYSYARGGELHLIDGQQRMTTLVLLAFFCACQEGESSDIVIASLKNFSYRVRIESELFLHSLFNHKNDFSKDTSLFLSEKLKDCNWYRLKFNTDTTIDSMVNSLDTIYKLWRKLGDNFKITTTWLLDHIKFWTFEVAQTSQGEELYISMNSRGEALTDSELLKPRLFERAKELKCCSAESWGKAWDNWEEFIFSNRGDNPVESVSDAMDSFFLIIFELESGRPHGKFEPVEFAKSVTLDKIEKYFGFLEIICKENTYKEEISCLYKSQHPSLILKTLISLLHADEEESEIKRIYPIIKNWERRGLLKNEGLLKVLYQFVNQEKRKGWLDYIRGLIDEKKAPNERKLDGVLDNHEWLKIKRYQSNNDEELESIFHNAEENTVLNGYLRPLWYEAFNADFNWDNKSKQTFKSRYEIFKALFEDRHITVNLSKKPEESRIDNSLLTRSLLSIKPYKVWVSGQNYAYGWKGKNKNYWQQLAAKPEVASIISKLIDELYQRGKYEEECLYSSLTEIIEKSKEKYKKDSGLFYIINYPTALKAQNEGHNVISLDGDWNNFNIWILEKDNAHSNYYNMFVSLLYSSFENNKNERTVQLNSSHIILNNNLMIKCSSIQGWDILYKNWEGNINVLKDRLMTLAKESGSECIDDDKTKKNKCFYITRGDNDQIDLGHAILEVIMKL